VHVTVAFDGPRNASVRSIVIEFGEHGSFTVLRVKETELNTVAKYHAWALRHMAMGKEVTDALWMFLNGEYRWTAL
jgi:hypothetical protein